MNSVKEFLNETEEVIKNLILKTKNAYAKQILEYFFQKKGKMLRPTLIFLTSLALKKKLSEREKKQVVYLAVAIELIHSASLVHDDIIDNENQRRKQIPVQKKYSSSIALILGDLIYIEAFLLLITEMKKEILEKVLQITKEMCFGEMDELNESVLNKEQYLNIVKNKTASLFSLCFQGAGIILNEDEEKVRHLKELGVHFGVIYQLVDDILDNDVKKTEDFNLETLIQQNKKIFLNHLEIFEDSLYKKSLIILIDSAVKKLML